MKEYMRYQTWAFKENNEPQAREITTEKEDAIKTGKKWAKKYFRVEVEAVYYIDEECTDIENTALVAAWENGKRTTK